jgi:hypothetical protein
MAVGPLCFFSAMFTGQMKFLETIIHLAKRSCGKEFIEFDFAGGLVRSFYCE